MATLIISDVHERLDRLAMALRGRVEKADRVVFLGDWFDAYGAVDLRRVGQVCGFLNGNVGGIFLDGDYTPDGENYGKPDKMVPATFLLGNHDCHYFFRHDGFKCSGYEPRKQEVIDANLPDVIREKFRIFTRVGPYLVSHAGFHEATLEYATEETEREALNTAFSGKMDPLFGAGYARGGWQKIGGCTWLDWDEEFDHISDCPQIVGHTQGNNVRSKGMTTSESRVEPNGTVDIGLPSYCLDTALHHIAFVDDVTGAVTIERCC